jgi:hypothetical protein
MGSEPDSTKLQYNWVLWYHDPENKDYSLNSYINISEFSDILQFWSVIDIIPKEAWDCGMFFFMRKGYLPLWESPEHESGGTWSKKIDYANAYTSFIDLMVHCISNEMIMSRTETLAGISISPKGQFSIVKIWNTTTNVSDKSYLNPKLTYFKITDDVTYTAHKSRPR